MHRFENEKFDLQTSRRISSKASSSLSAMRQGRGGIFSLFCPCFLGTKRHDVPRNESIWTEKTEVSEQVAEKI